MNVRRLIELSLSDIGVFNPDASMTEAALDHLNMIISNFTFWKPEDQPLERVTLSQTLQIPHYYLEIFELLLASREGLAYGVPISTIQTLEAKAKQLTDRLLYRRVQVSGMNSSGMVV